MLHNIVTLALPHARLVRHPPVSVPTSRSTIVIFSTTKGKPFDEVASLNLRLTAENAALHADKNSLAATVAELHASNAALKAVLAEHARVEAEREQAELDRQEAELATALGGGVSSPSKHASDASLLAIANTFRTTGVLPASYLSINVAATRGAIEKRLLAVTVRCAVPLATHVLFFPHLTASPLLYSATCVHSAGGVW